MGGIQTLLIVTKNWFTWRHNKFPVIYPARENGGYSGKFVVWLVPSRTKIILILYRNNFCGAYAPCGWNKNFHKLPRKFPRNSIVNKFSGHRRKFLFRHSAVRRIKHKIYWKFTSRATARTDISFHAKLAMCDRLEFRNTCILCRFHRTFHALSCSYWRRYPLVHP